MNTTVAFRNNAWNSFNWLLAGLALALAPPTRAATPPAAIPFSAVGARAAANYQGDALGVTATSDGARLRCEFQKLEGHATPEGLWLESTKPGAAGRLRLSAIALCRESSRARECALTEPEALTLFAPTDVGRYTALATSGNVRVNDKLVRFTRPGLTEEYSVSVDGVRQDFIIESPPLNPPPSAVLSTLRSATEDGLRRTGQRSTLRSTVHPARCYGGRATEDGSALNQSAGDLRLELALSGGRAEATAGGARLSLLGSGRTLAYSRLRVEDATGRQLMARLEVLSANRLVVSVADANAVYPIRIDPAFSDANWVSLNPGVPGASYLIHAVAVDGSGNVYVGGEFTWIGTTPANHVAKWNGSSWSALGPGLGGDVYALAVSGTNLYAGGGFSNAGGLTVNNIAQWDGSSWSILGSGLDSVVFALAVSGANLYAGGAFTVAGGEPANAIARWDGSKWTGLGPGMGGYYPFVNALAVSGSNVYAGGWFTNAGGMAANYIAKWDGGAWSAMGLGMNGTVEALATSGNELYAGGCFTSAGGQAANCIAKWDGRTWSALGSGIGGSPYATCVYALATSGVNLYVGGWFTNAGGLLTTGVAEWNGNAWLAVGSEMGEGNTEVYALAVSATNLYAGGWFTTAGGVPVNYIAKWNGNAWSALSSGTPGFDSRVDALAVSGTNLYAGGLFTMAGGVPANGVARWDGRTWSALGSGMGGKCPWVSALIASGNNLYAGGYFTMAGGVPANCTAKWDGNAWSALGSGLGAGMSAYVLALAVNGNNLYAGGNFANGGPASQIAQWDGTKWSALGSGISGAVESLAISGTNLYAGGNIFSAGYIAKWDGRDWSTLGLGVNNEVMALAVSGTNLFVGGMFTEAGGAPANYVARWDGGAWWPLGSGMDGSVKAFAVSGTNLYAEGTFTMAGGVPANGIAKWDGNAWSALASGLNACYGDHSYVSSLAADDMDHLFVGGWFYLAGTNVSPYIAQANVGSEPTILKPALTQTAEAGSAVCLAVDAAGELPLTYQWFFNGTDILSCTTSHLVLTRILPSESGTYTVVVSNAFGAVTSAPVALNVIPVVQRRPVPGIQITGQPGGLWDVVYADSLSLAPVWTRLASVTLSGTPQYYFDLTQPLAPQRFYRAWQTAHPLVLPVLDLHMVPAITVTGSMGSSVRVDAINRVGPTDAWFTLATVTLTNTSQLYFDVSAPGQPPRLYRLVQVP